MPRECLSIGILFLTGAAIGFSSKASNAQNVTSERAVSSFDETTRANYEQTVGNGRETFRFDTFGDEAFWAIHTAGGDQVDL